MEVKESKQNGRKGKLNLKNRIRKHFCSKHGQKVMGFFSHLNHHLIHDGELVIVIFATLFGMIFAGASSLPNNTVLEYPLQRVSILECRTTARDVMTGSNCKINLPIIEDANYEKYERKVTYRDIYSVLWGAPYNDTWNQFSGAHDGVDIATAKGTPLYSIGEGKVFYAGRQTGYGNVVKIEYIVDSEHVFAVYGHMDTMIVEKGDIVKKGEKIGTVGNSGNTFGALGGYHVHFEIAKDNSGRPMYSFLGCSDLNKGTYQVIMSGLCRNELVTHSYDPIEFIEKYKEVSKPADWMVSTGKNDTNLVDKGTNDNVVWSGKVVINEDDESDLKEIIKTDTGVNTTGANVGIVTGENTGENLIEFDFSKVSEGLKHFISQRNIEITTTGGNTNKIIGIGDKLILDIKVSNKKDLTTFVGLLKYAFGFITTNKNIETDMTNIQLIKSSGTKLVIEGKKVGKTTLIINLAGEKIGKLNIEVK